MSVRSVVERSGDGVCAGRAAAPGGAARRRGHWAVHPLVGLIQLYRFAISPVLGPSCRYLPTCSEYALAALEQHGLRHGLWLTIGRVGRCHPWGGFGYDPVPDADPHWHRSRDPGVSPSRPTGGRSGPSCPNNAT